MAYGESNDHVTDDITWPEKVKFVYQYVLLPYITRMANASLSTQGRLPVSLKHAIVTPLQIQVWIHLSWTTFDLFATFRLFRRLLNGLSLLTSQLHQ